MASQEGKRGVLSGIERALGAAADEILAPDEQLDLLPLPTKFDALDAARAEEQRRIVNFDNRARGVGGRPVGARNKSTQALLDYATKLGLDPMTFFLRWARHTPQTLATELNITAAEAFDRLVAINKEIRKVFIADAPALDDQGKPLPQFALQFTANGPVAIAVQPGQPVPPWLTDLEVAKNIAQDQQNQALTLDAAPQSHEAKSHEEGK